MKIRALFIAVLLSLSFSALADFVTVQRAYEVRLSTFNVPVTHNGVISFKECETCDAVSARLTGNTLFLVNGKAVELKEFRKQVFQVRDRSKKWVTVLHYLAEDTVTSISVVL